MSVRKEILRQSWIYSLGTQTAQLITLIAAVLSRRFLGPAQTGIWSVLQIIVDYSKYSTLGTMDAVSREIPFQIGKGNLEGAERIKNQAASFILVTSAALAAGIFLFAWAARDRLRPELFFGLLGVAGLILLQRMNNLLIALLRCYKRFDIEARLMVASAFVNAVLVGVLSFKFRIYGFLCAMLLSFIFNIFFVFSRYAFRFRWTWAGEVLKPLVRQGLPLLGLGLGVSLLRSLDKILVARYLGFESLGWYSIALMAVSYISNFPLSVTIVILPHFQEKHGRSEDPRMLESYLVKSSRVLVLIMPMMLAGVWLFAPYAVETVLPQFTPGIGAMKILTLSTFFLPLSQVYFDALVNIKKNRIVFPILLAAIPATALLDFAVLRAGWGIVGVAWATTVSLALYFCALYAAAMRLFSTPVRAFREGLFFFACFLGVGAALAAAEIVLPPGSLDTMPLRAGVFAMICFPFLVLLERQFQLLSMAAEKLRERFVKR